MEEMSVSERLAKMERELEALRQIKTEEDFNEGMRLHNEKNAPWVNGPYTHLGPRVLNPPYVYKEFPMMRYSLDYPDAVTERAEAELIPAIGMNDTERKKAIDKADRRIRKATIIVGNVQELKNLPSDKWFESPDAVVVELARLQTAKEHADANREFNDRHLSDPARREMRNIVDNAEDFVPEIPSPKRRGRPTSTAVIRGGKVVEGGKAQR